MSATIILIMTSSSTRNTDPRGGRVADIFGGRNVNVFNRNSACKIALSGARKRHPPACSGHGTGAKMPLQVAAHISRGHERIFLRCGYRFDIGSEWSFGFDNCRAPTVEIDGRSVILLQSDSRDRYATEQERS